MFLICKGDRPSQEEFLENLGAAASSLKDAVPKILEFMVDARSLSNL
jgi:hypothetical protein